MNSKSILLLALTLASCLTAARAEISVDVTAAIRLGRAMPPPPPEVVVLERIGPPEPPPWARRHWYHHSYAYYFYPGANVYYRPADHVWFYLEGGNWRIGARLPNHIHMDFGRAVSLSLESDRPYLFHERVVAYYPPNYFSRVRFRYERDEWREDHRDHDDHDRDRRR